MLQSVRLIAATLTGWLQARIDLESEKGATAVEYGIMVALIAAVIVVIVTALGGSVQGAFDKVCDAITTGGCTP